jgi:hypothetical protein
MPGWRFDQHGIPYCLVGDGEILDVDLRDPARANCRVRSVWTPAGACGEAGATAAKLEGSLGVHTLRHTFATHAVAAGVPLSVVSRQLGHADIHTTMGYAHHAPEASADAWSVDDSSTFHPLENEKARSAKLRALSLDFLTRATGLETLSTEFDQQPLTRGQMRLPAKTGSQRCWEPVSLSSCR